MSRIEGPSRRVIARRGDEFGAQLHASIRDTLRAVTARWDGVISLDDLAPIMREWTRRVDVRLLDEVGQSYVDAARTTRVAQRDELVRILRANGAVVASAANESFEIPLVRVQQAIDLMAEARNRLVNVGNEVWEVARGELVAGLLNDEDPTALRRRVLSAAGLTESRASVVARTEVSGAMNAGALAQMRQIDAPSMTREWIATHDLRTRPAHRALDGTKVGVNQTFPGGDEPGRDPNCRCTQGFDIPDDSLVSAACGCDDALLASAALTATIDLGRELGSVCVCPSKLASTPLTDRQYEVLSPGRRSKNVIVKELNLTRHGKSVLDSIRSFTEKRGGVANLRKLIDKVTSGESISAAVRAKIDDFIGALNGYPIENVPTLYRGLAIKVEEDTNAWWDALEARYQVGQTIELNVSSFTSSEKKAAEFQGMIGGTKRATDHSQWRFVLDGPTHALPVEQLSKFASEKEWLAGGEFVVTSFEPATTERPYYLVHIKQLESLSV